MRNTRILEAYLGACRLMDRQSETLELPVRVLSTFLAVAIHGIHNVRPGDHYMSLEELADLVGRQPSSISQHLRYLGVRYREGKPGMGLVFTTEYPDNGRKKTFGLTPRGAAIVNQLEAIFVKALQ